MLTVIYIAQIILSIVVIVLIAMQGQEGGMGSAFGSDTTVYRTRRGLEKTLFQVTIAVAALFFIISMVAVIIAK